MDEKIEQQGDNLHELTKGESQNLIKKIKVNKFYIHCGFCCIRNISNINNILLDEGMKLIVEQLDIINVFRKLYTEAKRNKELKEQTIIINMSDECNEKLTKIFFEINKKNCSSILQ